MKVRSVDNYQGEEADVRMQLGDYRGFFLTYGQIIILSLVRNSGAGGDIRDQATLETRRRQNIGFLKVNYLSFSCLAYTDPLFALKSENRTNGIISFFTECQDTH